MPPRWPLCAGESAAAPHERLFWRTGGGEQLAVRENRFKLVRLRGSSPQLYDLDADVAESRDLAAAQPDRVTRLNTRLQAWNRQLIPPLFESPRPAAKK